jgi:hypothetical protein
MRQSSTLKRLEAHLVAGAIYRRAELGRLSSNIDRHLVQLVANGRLRKLSQGLYMAPKETSFGEAPPDSHNLIRAFLKDDHFVVYGPSQFNALGLGTTQLYNRLTVFNRKRVGEFTLAGRVYTFHRWREAPKQLTPEFLIVELLNRLDELAEDRQSLLKQLREKISSFNRRRLIFAASRYGTLSTQKRMATLFEESEGVKP